MLSVSSEYSFNDIALEIVGTNVLKKFLKNYFHAKYISYARSRNATYCRKWHGRMVNDVLKLRII